MRCSLQLGKRILQNKKDVVVTFYPSNILGTVTKKRREDIAIQEKKDKEAAELKAAQKLAEENGKACKLW